VLPVLISNKTVASRIEAIIVNLVISAQNLPRIRAGEDAAG
jgi:hypothetical protein